MWFMNQTCKEDFSHHPGLEDKRTQTAESPKGFIGPDNQRRLQVNAANQTKHEAAAPGQLPQVSPPPPFLPVAAG